MVNGLVTWIARAPSASEFVLKTMYGFEAYESFTPGAILNRRVVNQEFP